MVKKYDVLIVMKLLMIYFRGEFLLYFFVKSICFARICTRKSSGVVADNIFNVNKMTGINPLKSFRARR